MTVGKCSQCGVGTFGPLCARCKGERPPSREVEEMRFTPARTTGIGAPKNPGGGHAGVRTINEFADVLAAQRALRAAIHAYKTERQAAWAEELAAASEADRATIAARHLNERIDANRASGLEIW